MSVPGTHFDRQPHTRHMVTGAKEQIHNCHNIVTGVIAETHNGHDMVVRGSKDIRKSHHMVTGAKEHIHNRHHMVTGQTAQTNQFPEFLTGRIQTPRNPSTHQYQNLSTQVSQDNNLPVLEQTPRNQNSDTNNSNNRLADAIAGIATQQRLQAATMLKPVSTNTLIFDGKTEKFELFEDLFHTMLKMQPEMTENQPFSRPFTKRSTSNIQKYKCIKQENSRPRANCVSTKICQTRITGYSQTQMAQTHIRS